MKRLLFVVVLAATTVCGAGCNPARPRLINWELLQPGSGLGLGMGLWGNGCCYESSCCEDDCCVIDGCHGCHTMHGGGPVGRPTSDGGYLVPAPSGSSGSSGNVRVLPGPETLPTPGKLNN